MSLRRILLVDDDSDLRRIAILSLTRIGGWDVIGAASGSEAVELALTSVPDLIILDAMMPGLDGLATLAKLRVHAELALVPVVFMTAKVQRNDVDKYLRSGALGVIPKPFDPMSLPQQVRALAHHATGDAP